MKQSNTDLCLVALKVETEAGRCGAPPVPGCVQVAAGPEVCTETSPSESCAGARAGGGTRCQGPGEG